MSRKHHEPMPTQEQCPQIADAIFEIGNGDFRIMSDDVRPDVVRPVFYEPVFLDDDETIVSQKTIYTSNLVRKPHAAQMAIDRVTRAFEITEPDNPVKKVNQLVEGWDIGDPDYLDELIPVIDEQATNPSRVIGGLLMVKHAETAVVGLRYVYNRALLETSPTWQMRDYALEGGLNKEVTKGLKARDPDTVGDVAVHMVAHCLKASKKLKPAIVFAPTLGLQGL